MKYLTSQSTWAGRHDAQRLAGRHAFRRSPNFRQQGTLLERLLPKGPTVRTLEIGCFPGGFLEYFHKVHGHCVTGIDYVQESCDQCREMLETRETPAEIIHGDLFDDSWNATGTQWDVVFSAGLIEHFDDSSPAIDAHLRLTSPAGYCVISIPNHSSIRGRLMKLVNRPMWEIHNRMSAHDLQDAFERSPDSNRFELLHCGYVEHVGLWNCGVYERFRAMGRLPFRIVRGAGLVAEAALRWVPNSRAFSPNILLIAKARNTSEASGSDSSTSMNGASTT
ncbi:MAG: class I SAM-dependent methyltransferase [Phycisphaerales bacterium]|nr:class I SAM-dependent methyltransferase [Phycisphaerales bacterium]